MNEMYTFTRSTALDASCISLNLLDSFEKLEDEIKEAKSRRVQKAYVQLENANIQLEKVREQRQR